MAIREKLRKTFGRGSGSASNSIPSSGVTSTSISGLTTPSLITESSISGSPADRDHLTIDPRENPLTQIETNGTATKKSTIARIKSAMKKDDPYKDWPEDIYKPHEMPRPKYRRPVDPNHAESLGAYSLHKAFANMRPRSFLSQYSPGASRLPSRMGSIASRGGQRSKAPSRAASIAADRLQEDSGSSEHLENVGLPRHPSTTAPIPILARRRTDTITSASTLSNTTQTTVPDLVQSSSVDSEDTSSEDLPSSGGGGAAGGDAATARPTRGASVVSPVFGKPFDEEELTRALTSTRLVVEA